MVVVVESPPIILIAETGIAAETITARIKSRTDSCFKILMTSFLFFREALCSGKQPVPTPLVVLLP